MKKILLSVVLLANVSLYGMAGLKKDLSSLQMQLARLQRKLGELVPTPTPPPTPIPTPLPSITTDSLYKDLLKVAQKKEGFGKVTDQFIEDKLKEIADLRNAWKNDKFKEQKFPEEIDKLKISLTLELSRRIPPPPTPTPDKKEDIAKSSYYKFLYDQNKKLEKAGIKKVAKGVLRNIVNNYDNLEKDINGNRFTKNEMPQEFTDLRNAAQEELKQRELKEEPKIDISKMTPEEIATKRDEVEDQIKKEKDDYNANPKNFTKDNLREWLKQINFYIYLVHAIDEEDDNYQDRDDGIMRFRLEIELILELKKKK